MDTCVYPDGVDYTSVGPIPLTFDRNNSEFPISIDILNDQVHELDEDFFGRLSTDDPDAILDPGQTRVRILDDDGMSGLCAVLMHYNYWSSSINWDYSCDVHFPSTCVHVHGGCWNCNSVCGQDWKH